MDIPYQLQRSRPSADDGQLRRRVPMDVAGTDIRSKLASIGREATAPEEAAGRAGDDLRRVICSVGDFQRAAPRSFTAGRIPSDKFAMPEIIETL